MPNLLSAQDKVKKALKSIQKEIKKVARFQSLKCKEVNYKGIDPIEISRQSLYTFIRKSALKDVDFSELLPKKRDLTDVERKIYSLTKLQSFVKKLVAEIVEIYNKKRKMITPPPKPKLEQEGDPDPTPQRKNRPGQRQRQKINESIYKENAKHLIKQKQQKLKVLEEEKLHPSWEAKRMQKIVTDVKPTKIKFE